jgi:arginine decarboxylase
MNTKYIDLIQQTFDYPQKEFKNEGDKLLFHDIDLMNLVTEYGPPL